MRLIITVNDHSHTSKIENFAPSSGGNVSFRDIIKTHKSCPKCAQSATKIYAKNDFTTSFLEFCTAIAAYMGLEASAAAQEVEDLVLELHRNSP